MAVSLLKGQNVSLTKQDPSLRQITVGLGWNLRRTDGAAFDLDASVFLLDAQDRVLSDRHFVFYNNPQDPSLAVTLSGDNRDGQGEGDDESVQIDLSLLSPDVAKIAFVVTIHDAEARRQNFGQVNQAFIRAVNTSTKQELARYDLSEDASLETAMVFGELYRYSAEWKFKALGQGYAGGLAAVAQTYGVHL